MTRALHTIVSADHGRFTVLRMIPVPIADFNHLEDAELFAQAAEAAVAVPITGSDAPSPTATPTETAARNDPAPAAAEFAKASTDPASEKPQPVARSEPDLEPDWPAAFARLRSGEKLGDVAADMGIPMPKLRGKWASCPAEVRQAQQSPEAGSDAAVAKRMTGSDLVAVVRNELTGGDDEYRRAPARSALLSWTPDEDAEVASAREEELPALAAKLGRSLNVLIARRKMLEAQIAKEMSDG